MLSITQCGTHWTKTRFGFILWLHFQLSIKFQVDIKHSPSLALSGPVFYAGDTTNCKIPLIK